MRKVSGKSNFHDEEDQYCECNKCMIINFDQSDFDSRMVQMLISYKIKERKMLAEKLKENENKLIKEVERKAVLRAVKDKEKTKEKRMRKKKVLPLKLMENPIKEDIKVEEVEVEILPEQSTVVTLDEVNEDDLAEDAMEDITEGDGSYVDIEDISEDVKDIDEMNTSESDSNSENENKDEGFIEVSYKKKKSVKKVKKPIGKVSKPKDKNVFMEAYIQWLYDMSEKNLLVYSETINYNLFHLPDREDHWSLPKSKRDDMGRNLHLHFTDEDKNRAGGRKCLIKLKARFVEGIL